MWQWLKSSMYQRLRVALFVIDGFFGVEESSWFLPWASVGMKRGKMPRLRGTVVLCVAGQVKRKRNPDLCRFISLLNRSRFIGLLETASGGASPTHKTGVGIERGKMPRLQMGT